MERDPENMQIDTKGFWGTVRYLLTYSTERE